MTAAFPYKIVIDIAAASKDLTVVARIARELGVTFTSPESDYMEELIHEASSIITDSLNRELAEEKGTDHYRTACAVDELWTSLWPISTVHAIVEDGVTLVAADYEIDAKAGVVWRLDGDDNRQTWLGGVKITIQHTSGYELLTDLPQSIERACIVQVLAQYNARRRDPAVRSFEIPDVYKEQIAIAGGDNFDSAGLLLSVAGPLFPYRRLLVG